MKSVFHKFLFRRLPGFNSWRSCSNGRNVLPDFFRPIGRFLSEMVELALELVHAGWLFTPKFPTLGLGGNIGVDVYKPSFWTIFKSFPGC